MIDETFDTIGDLVEYLKTFDQALPFGRIGYYGDFYPMVKTDFHPYLAYSLRREKDFYKKIIAICVPYVGEEPD